MAPPQSSAQLSQVSPPVQAPSPQTSAQSPQSSLQVSQVSLPPALALVQVPSPQDSPPSGPEQVPSGSGLPQSAAQLRQLSPGLQMSSPQVSQGGASHPSLPHVPQSLSQLSQVSEPGRSHHHRWRGRSRSPPRSSRSPRCRQRFRWCNAIAADAVADALARVVWFTAVFLAALAGLTRLTCAIATGVGTGAAVLLTYDAVVTGSDVADAVPAGAIGDDTAVFRAARGSSLA